MRYRNSRQVTGVVKNVTVSQSCGKWYISIQTESEVSTPVHPSASMVGLDAGVCHEKIRNQRKDFQHKLSASLAESFDAVCVEDMSREWRT